MLESMMASARPTRAEVADITNAIHDGTDALMLSGETAVGRYPVEAVITMAQVAKKTDEVVEQLPRLSPAIPDTISRVDSTFSHALGLAASRAAEDVNAKCITCFTMTGYSARMISRQRPRKPVVAVTMSEETRRRCALYWGVQTLEGEETESLNAMVKQVDEILSREGLARQGDTVIIVGGSPLLIGGRANFLKLHQLGESETRR
jgi:pyruvate kinase